MKRIAVLGTTGMLGHAVARTFEADARFEVERFCRNPRQGELWLDATLPDRLNDIRNFDYVINCIGLIKQVKFAERREMFMVNAVFPWMLQQHCAHVGAKLIHVTSDCAFSGKVGSYSELDRPDADDDYGLSKLCGEPRDAMVLRTSIIGHELRGNLSLLEWVISNRGKSIQGFTNHIWNGVSSNELARIFWTIVLNDWFEPGVHHVHSNKVSKYELVELINQQYDLRITVVPHETPLKCDRSLSTIKTLNQKLKVPTVQEMVVELATSRSCK